MTSNGVVGNRLSLVVKISALEPLLKSFCMGKNSLSTVKEAELPSLKMAASSAPISYSDVSVLCQKEDPVVMTL